MFLLPLAQHEVTRSIDPQAGWMNSMLSGMSGNDMVAVVLTSILCITGVAIVLAFLTSLMIKTIHRRSAETQLKREMLDRGFSVDEIVKLIEATAPANPGRGSERNAGLR